MHLCIAACVSSARKTLAMMTPGQCQRSTLQRGHGRRRAVCRYAGALSCVAASAGWQELALLHAAHLVWANCLKDFICSCCCSCCSPPLVVTTAVKLAARACGPSPMMLPPPPAAKCAYRGVAQGLVAALSALRNARTARGESCCKHRGGLSRSDAIHVRCPLRIYASRAPPKARLVY